MPIEHKDLFSFIESILPAQTTDFFLPIIQDIAENPRGGLLSVVFLLAIFLMSNGINAIFSGFEYSYHVTMNRTVIKQYFVALLVSVFLALLLLFSIFLIVYSEYLIATLQSEEIISNNVHWVTTIRYIIFVALVYLVIAILYYFGVKQGRTIRFFSLGALVTTLLFMATTYFFGIYINNFSNYNELYGSIGALLILMLYIWINSNILLLGFELNATLKSLKGKNN